MLPGLFYFLIHLVEMWIKSLTFWEIHVFALMSIVCLLLCAQSFLPTGFASVFVSLVRQMENLFSCSEPQISLNFILHKAVICQRQAARQQTAVVPNKTGMKSSPIL